MRGASVLALAALLALGGSTARASHDWGGIDVCSAYRGTAPPGVEPASLPEPSSPGGRLLRRYCTQCHRLPGPGRHTAGEWPAVLERMSVLMDASQRFRGLMGRIEAPDAGELRTLRAYLTAHALKPMEAVTRGSGAQAFLAHCAGCHALPDPRQHKAGEWPAIVERMRRNAVVMGQEAWAGEVGGEIAGFLKRSAGERLAVAPDADPRAERASTGGSQAGEASPGLGRLLPLLPVFLVAALGALRGWHGARRRRQSEGEA